MVVYCCRSALLNVACQLRKRLGCCILEVLRDIPYGPIGLEFISQNRGGRGAGGRRIFTDLRCPH
jgi:hypothetical protein